MIDTGKVYIIKYPAEGRNALPDVNRQEALRYAGYSKAFLIQNEQTGFDADFATQDLLDQVASDLLPMCSYGVCYALYDITWKGSFPFLPFEQTSRDLARCLKDCHQVILFAATAGLGIDRYIMRQEHLSPSKALMAQAIGAERVEALCQRFCMDMEESARADGLSTTPRYSPGYGDLPLRVQVDFFRLLDPSRNLGISLSDSFLMIPSKSVTAVIGIRKNEST